MSNTKSAKTTQAAKDKKAAAKKKEQEKRAKAKAKANEAAVKGAQQNAMRELVPIAKEINIRFEKAAQMDGKADDMRLAAAIRIAEAKEKCDAAKINFKRWAEDNIKEQTYETVRKLLPVGQSSDPAAALADMRNKNKAANKKARDKKAKEVGSSAPQIGNSSKGQSKTNDPFIHSEQVLLSLDDKTRRAVVDAVANRDNLVTVGKDELKKLQKQAEAAIVAPKNVPEDASIAEFKKAFGQLKASDKMEFLSWAAKEVGVQIVNPLGV